MKLAADQGLTEAEYDAAYLYVTGKGLTELVTEEAAEARRWFERAAAKGHENAKAALAAWDKCCAH